jgi:hypothetical protein
MMKLLIENFRDQTITNVVREQYRYRQDQQKREEDALRNAAIKKQKGSNISLLRISILLSFRMADWRNFGKNKNSC